MTTKQITVDESDHEALKREARVRGMTLQAFTRMVVRTGLRMRGIDVIGDDS